MRYDVNRVKALENGTEDVIRVGSYADKAQAQELWERMMAAAPPGETFTIKEVTDDDTTLS